MRRLQADSRLYDYRLVVFLSENTCPSCNQIFSRTIEQHVLGRDSVLVIVNAKGRSVNLTSYWDYKGKNLVFDYTDNFYRLHLSSGSCFIILDENRIDSIVSINPDNLQESVSFFYHHP